VIVAHDGAQSGIQLRVSPLASRALFGCPAGELASIDAPAEDVFGQLAGELHGGVAGAASWRERFAILDAALSPRIDPARAVPAAVEHAWRLLLGSGGRASIGAIARRVGWTERHLANRFREEIGLTPKLAARIVRFDRARRALQAQHVASGRADIARVAAECGYFDQSHLDRDFTDFARLPPSRWLAHEFGNVQDGRLLAA
jgi:AraC-like DNA-binding protein